MADNCASSQSAEEIVSEKSLPLVKAELQKRGLPAEGKKPVLMARLIVAIKQEESKPSCSQNNNTKSTQVIQSLNRPCQLTTGLQHQLVNICRRSLPIIS